MASKSRKTRSGSAGDRLARWASAATVVFVVAILAVFAGHARLATTATPTRSTHATTPVWAAVRGPKALIHQLVRAPWGALYAGTTQGVYASSDGGVTWQALGQGFPGPGIEAWGVAAITGPGGDAILATCGDGAVYRLPRAGGRWARGTGQVGTLGAYAVYALPGGVALAGSDRGIFRSTDGGRSWTQTARLPGDSVAVAAFARDPADGTVYAGVAGLPDALRVSADGGLRWRVPSGVLPPPSVEALLAVPGRVYAGVMGAPGGGRPVWAGDRRGFAPLGHGLPSDVHGMSLAVDGIGGRLFMGGMGTGVYVSTSLPTSGANASGRWVRLGRGPGDGVITALLVLPGAHPALLAGTGAGIYRLAL